MVQIKGRGWCFWQLFNLDNKRFFRLKLKIFKFEYFPDGFVIFGLGCNNSAEQEIIVKIIKKLNLTK